MIAVVLGAETSQIRNKEVAKILDYGFANYKTEVIAEEKEVMEEITIERGNPQKIKVLSKGRVTVLSEKGNGDSITSEIVINKKITLPITKGDEVGKLVVYEDEKEIGEYSLVSNSDVKKASFRQIILRAFRRTT